MSSPPPSAIAIPLSHDPVAARSAGYVDVVAPPTFAITITLPAGDQVTQDPELGLDYSRVVHGDQRFLYQRQIVAGDELRVIVTVGIDPIGRRQ